MHPSRLLLLFLLLPMVLAHPRAGAQSGGALDIYLQTDYRSAEQTLDLYRGLGGRPAEVAHLRGSQIALATTSLLAQRPFDQATLERHLEAAKFNQRMGDDVFLMAEARQHEAEIRELLVEMQRRNFGQRVVSTVAQLFPASAQVRTRVPLYFVAFGHRNIDAFVRRVVWRGDTPQFVGEGEGELSIVVNLAKAVSYGESTDERFLHVLSVVAHEVFHAAFGAYKDVSPEWRQYYARATTPFDQLLDIAQNEGVAYYLSLIQSSRGRFTAAGEQKVRSAFEQFNRNAEELLDARTPPGRAMDILRRANTSSYWENYGSIAGMIVARQIDQTSGRAGLSETLTTGPMVFFRKYAELCRNDNSLPPLSHPVLEALARRR
jgi:hypothetical protein